MSLPPNLDALHKAMKSQLEDSSKPDPDKKLLNELNVLSDFLRGASEFNVSMTGWEKDYPKKQKVKLCLICRKPMG